MEDLTENKTVVEYSKEIFNKTGDTKGDWRVDSGLGVAFSPFLKFIRRQLNGRRVKLNFHINLIPTPTEYAEFYICTLTFGHFATAAEKQ
jgi:hypothetical protein